MPHGERLVLLDPPASQPTETALPPAEFFPQPEQSPPAPQAPSAERYTVWRRFGRLLLSNFEAPNGVPQHRGVQETLRGLTTRVEAAQQRELLRYDNDKERQNEQLAACDVQILTSDYKSAEWRADYYQRLAARAQARTADRLQAGGILRPLLSLVSGGFALFYNWRARRAAARRDAYSRELQTLGS